MMPVAATSGNAVVPTTSFTFTTHIDSAYATWYTPLGALSHWFIDVRDKGKRRKPLLISLARAKLTGGKLIERGKLGRSVEMDGSGHIDSGLGNVACTREPNHDTGHKREKRDTGQR